MSIVVGGYEDAHALEDVHRHFLKFPFLISEALSSVVSLLHIGPDHLSHIPIL